MLDDSVDSHMILLILFINSFARLRRFSTENLKENSWSGKNYAKSQEISINSLKTFFPSSFSLTKFSHIFRRIFRKETIFFSDFDRQKNDK